MKVHLLVHEKTLNREMVEGNIKGVTPTIVFA